MIAIVGGAIAAIIAAAVLAIFKAPVRERFWKPIGRGLRWPFTLRLTTSSRQAVTEREMALLRDKAATNAKRFQEVCDLLDVSPVLPDSTLVQERIQRLQEASGEAWAHAKAEIETAQEHARSQIAATQSLAEMQMRETARTREREIELAREAAHEEGRTLGRAERTSEVEAQRATPPLQPVWRIDDPGPGGNRFYLRNMQNGVEIADVSVEANTNEFMFASSTQTRGPFGESFSFLGSKSHHGVRFGVDFTVRWRDSNGDWWARTVKVDRDPLGTW